MSAKKPYAKVHIEISNVCNLQCSFCPEVQRLKGYMTPEAFAQALDEVAPLAEQICLHLMGEPLLHPHFAEIVTLARAKGVQIFLVSNGVLLRERHHALLLDPVFRQLNFSLHSFRDNFGDTDPTPYMKRIFALTEKAFEERPDLYINYRLWNLDDPRASNEGSRRILSLIEERFQVSVETTIDVRRQKSYRLANRLYLHFDTEFVWPSMDLPEHGQQGRCYGLKSHFGILVDGTVVPCCLDKEGVIPLGNIKNAPLAEILASQRAQAMVKGFREGRLVEALCRRCNYIERFKPQTAAATV